ncbi:MAG: hypothetical protein Q7S16_04105 [bacterium]|nr:hypothetical protein [bacterium]
MPIKKTFLISIAVMSVLFVLGAFSGAHEWTDTFTISMYLVLAICITLFVAIAMLAGGKVQQLRKEGQWLTLISLLILYILIRVVFR